MSQIKSTSKFGKLQIDRMLINVKAFCKLDMFLNYIMWSLQHPDIENIMKSLLIEDEDDEKNIILSKTDLTKIIILNKKKPPGIDLCGLMENLTLKARNISALSCDKSLLTDIDNVLKNTYKSERSNEFYIDKLAESILRMSGFDSEPFFLARSKRMKLTIDNRSFSSNADMHIIYKPTMKIVLVVENKHISSTTYKAGELQLICHILASFQENDKIKLEENPKQIWGLRIHSHKIYFYYMHYDDVYLNNLKTGRFNKSINIARFPSASNDMSVRYRRDRFNLFKILSFIKDSINRP